MAGLAVLLRKELLESWRTYRLPVVAGLFLFVGLSSPLLARYLPEILEAAGGDQFGGLQLPTPTAADAVDQLWKNLAQFGAFAAIILAMGAVAGEKDRGTAAFVLSKTASRGGFLGAKVVAIAAVLGIGTILAVAVGWIYTAILFAPPSVPGWIALGVLAWLGARGLGGDHVPRQHRHRLHRRGRGHRVHGAAAPLDRVRRAERHAVHARRPRGSGDRPRGRCAGRARRCPAPGPLDHALIAIALGAAAWSFRRQEL